MQKKPRHQASATIGLCGTLQFLFLSVMLAVVGSRVASLVVLEFSLRAVSAWVTAGPVRHLQDNNINVTYNYMKISLTSPIHQS